MRSRRVDTRGLPRRRGAGGWLQIAGGHSFNRMDTPLARESRKEIYEFLARYLKR